MILLIHNKKNCREIQLPIVFDTDWPITLSKSQYQLNTEVTLNLENRGGNWYIRSGSNYTLKRDGVREESFRFENETVTEVKTSGGERIHIVASDSETKFRVMTKYDLTAVNEIHIGAREDNDIQYCFMGLVSGHHLTIRRDGSRWTIVDTSTNGSFIDGRRFTGAVRLHSGEHINIFGLHIIRTGQYLSIGVNCGEVEIKSDWLRRARVEKKKTESEYLPVRREHTVSFFNRSPRELKPLIQEKLEIEPPPQPRQEKQKPTYMVIGPAFTMAIPMMLGCLMMVTASWLSKKTGGLGTSPFIFMGLTIAVGAGIVGAVWAVLNLRYNKEQQLAEEEERFNAYGRYLMGIVQNLRSYYQYNSETLLHRYPSAADCMRYNRNSSKLWNRNSSHDDFLFLRLGLGEMPFQMDIDIPKERFSLINDSLQDRPRRIKEDFSKLLNVPIGINLFQERLVGLVGGKDREGAYPLMQLMATEIAATHVYTDVKMVFLFDESDRRHLPVWESMKWFPHVWSEDLSVRYLAGNRYERGDILFQITDEIRNRAGEDSSRNNTSPLPHYVIFISDPRLLEGELLTKYIYNVQSAYGLTTILMAESVRQLPNTCRMVIENDAYFQGIVDLAGDTQTGKKQIRFDQIDVRKLSSFGKILSNIRVKEMETSSEIPTSLGFLEMFGVHRPQDLGVEERWRKNRTYHSMQALIGRKAGGQNCYLDIHEKFHGPHGLVAGTTGSGKSETLQTYILSLAVNYSPDDVSFFVIDYKGGGMANLFSGMPHLAGQISNLSGNQVRRAMISIKSENLRRQKLFADNNVNHISAYTRLYKEHRVDVPIPHLIIIIDEFAELKREEPAFMQELISVAQVGRSLGVHLILATQKPSGTVDDHIQANSKFRLCLRVQDRQDSIDMLHRPDAAYLTQTGRCYLQVGNDELFELFQSGYSGATYTGEAHSAASAMMLERTGRMNLSVKPSLETGKESAQTELTAVISHLRDVMIREHVQPAAKLWLPVLGDHIVLDTGKGSEWTENWWQEQKGLRAIRATVGRYDDPARQAQGDYAVDFSQNGHLAVCGSVVSGKSTFLQTMIYSLITNYSPERVQLYILDYSAQMLTSFEKAPHVGGTITESQPERVSKFFVMLLNLMEERKGILRGGNFNQYIQAYGESLPAIIVVIDNYPLFREKTEDKFDSVVSRVVREGAGYGIYLVLSATGFGMSEIPSRTGDYIGTILTLEQQDKFKYMDILRTTRLQIIPESGIKGRGLAAVGESILEFQTCLCMEAEDDFSRGQQLEALSEKMAQKWTGVLPREIPEIPANPVMDIFSDLSDYKAALENKDLIPVGYDATDASVFSLDLKYNYCMAITGKARTGKTNVLRAIMYSALKKGGNITVLEKRQSEFSVLQRDAQAAGVRYAGTDAEIFQFFSDLLPEFSRRNKKKQELIHAGYNEQQLQDAMSEETPYYIFIDDMADFMQCVYKPAKNVGSMHGFLENIWEKGRLHGIYFFAGLNVDDEAPLAVHRAYNLFVSYKRGLHCGGNLAGQKLFRFQNVSYANQTQIRKKGFVIVSDGEDENMGREIVIPLVEEIMGPDKEEH